MFGNKIKIWIQIWQYSSDSSHPEKEKGVIRGTLIYDSFKAPAYKMYFLTN